MAVISGYTELLIERDLPATTQKESLHRIFRNTRALTKLVDDLLNVTRIQSGSITISPEPLIFRDVVEEVLASIRLDYDGSDFVIDTPPGLPLIYADRSKLSQVMANLLENAVKYSPPPGGRVTVSATHNPERDCVIVAVADQGIGISLEDQASLFTTFHRILRPETEGVRGSGLELYIVKELMGIQVDPIISTTKQLSLHHCHEAKAGGVATPNSSRHSSHGPGG